jgi:DNA-binding beta-propeller fold protein YncE
LVHFYTTGDSITDYDFSIVDGALPEGLTCGCKWVGQWPSTTYKCSIEGTISCNGESAPCSKRGLYKFTVGMTGKLFGQDRYTERAFELPVFDGAGDAIVAPPEGTTAGGTKVRVYMRQNLTLADAAFKMTLKDAACQAPLSGMAPLPVESQTLLYHDSSTNYIQYELTTPRGLEGCADVVLYAKTLPLRTITNGYQYKTLAYTANQNDESLSVVDATQNQPFTPQTGIHAPAGTVPFGMELALDGRTLWVTDYAAGNLQRYDAANLEYQGTLPLQDPNQPYEGYGATDVAVDSQGTAYVIHQTTGLEAYPEGSPYWNPAYGGISLVDTAAGEVVDWDGDEMTTSDGAPDGISRIPLDLYPLSIAILRLDRDPGQYIEGDGWPGEYAFISGVGPYVPIYPISWRCICKKLMDQPPFEVCEYPCHWCGGSQWPLARRLCWPQRYQPRPVRIAILDLNPWKYALNDQGILARAINPNYRRIIGWGDIGTYGQNPGISSQGLDFSVAYAGTTPTGATVLAASPGEERVYAFDFLSAVREPHTFLLEEHPVYCADADGNYATCYPTDVKVQKGVKGPDSTSKTVALVTNSWNDSISVLNLDQPTQFIANVVEDNACTARDRYPLSIDTRTDAKHAYVADYQSVTASGRSTLGVVNLDTMAMNAPACEIEVGPAPVRVVVQPVVVASDLSQAIQTDLAYAEPTSFADATKQDILIQEWNTVHLLQETGANPQAVVVNINNFQRSVNRWVTAPALQTDLNQAVDLYRAAYLKEHPAGQ